MKARPTEVELQILNVLWEHGASTVRQVHDALQSEKETNYATTVKMLVVMFEKGLVNRDQSVRPQLYKAAITRNSTQKRVLKNLVKNMFSGSASSLVLQALSTGKATTEELEQIRELVDELQKKESGSRSNNRRKKS